MELTRRICVLLIVIAGFPAAGFAQFDSGQISGFVRDGQQAAIPGATVIVTNQGNGDHRSSVTNAAGFYVFPDLPVGMYSVTVELSGFKKFVQTDLRLSAASQMAVDGVLEVGSLEETVEVRASPSQVQTTTAQVARTIDTRQIQALTLNGRNPIYLASLKPGVRGGTIGTFDPDSVSSGSFSINGARDDEYVVMVDGAIATRTRSSGSMLGAQDVETVDEVQILTASYRAEYGRSSAGCSAIASSGSRGNGGNGKTQERRSGDKAEKTN
jgi:hypothetical protein